MKHQDLREEIARVAGSLIGSGLVTGTSGNVSAQTPEGDVLITPSGLAYDVLGPDDVVLVDRDANVLEGELVPSTEVPMHTGIYKARPNVGAVVHTHSRFATTLACLGWPIPPVHYMLTTLSEEGRVPLAPYHLYGTEGLADNAAEALGESHNACLLRDAGGDGRDLLQDAPRRRTYTPHRGADNRGGRQDLHLRPTQKSQQLKAKG